MANYSDLLLLHRAKSLTEKKCVGGADRRHFFHSTPPYRMTSTHARTHTHTHTHTVVSRRRAWNRADAAATREGKEGPPLPDWDAEPWEVHRSAPTLEAQMRDFIALAYAARALLDWG